MFMLSINTDSAAFADNAKDEIKRILVEFAEHFAIPNPFRHEDPYPISDVNGNPIGYGYFHQ